MQECKGERWGLEGWKSGRMGENLSSFQSFPFRSLLHGYLGGVDSPILAFVGGNLKGFWDSVNA